MEINGQVKHPSQCNNVFVFPGARCRSSCGPFPGGDRGAITPWPGVGAGAALCKAKRVTDRMFYSSAEALSRTLTDEERDLGMVFPDIGRIRDVTTHVASAGWCPVQPRLAAAAFLTFAARLRAQSFKAPFRRAWRATGAWCGRRT